MEQLPLENPSGDNQQPKQPFRSLKELIDFVSGRQIKNTTPGEDAGFAESLPFPFMALVGQYEMKMALLLALINPALGGVLLIGPRGTGKTTAVRSLLDLLPMVVRSTCFYGCLPEDIENGGMDAVCPECAKKFGEGVAFSKMDRARLVEIPLNTNLPDVIGSLDDAATVNERMRLKRGLLAQADRNILYLDEVNLLSREVIDAILDAAAQGAYTVHRNHLSATYRARFTLIGSMNPEEGTLRPQILDRFGLRVFVKGLTNPEERLEAFRRVNAYVRNPRQTIAQYSDETNLASEEIEVARVLLPKVEITDSIARLGIDLVHRLNIDSLRAEITLFEAARAHAAAEGRVQVDLKDITAVAQICLRMRRSIFMDNYFSHVELDEKGLISVLSEYDIPSK